MGSGEFTKNYEEFANKRYEKTYAFIEDVLQQTDRILDIGPLNPFSKIMTEKGYSVANTPEGVDLDLDYSMVEEPYDVVTAFEILEHLVSPFPLVKSIKAPKFIASVPLNLWFATAYWNEKDPYDRHYHEFEPRQLDMLLDKAGWKIIKSEKWVSKTNKIGIRPILRNFTPRYYIVYCERK